MTPLGDIGLLGEQTASHALRCALSIRSASQILNVRLPLEDVVVDVSQRGGSSLTGAETSAKLCQPQQQPLLWESEHISNKCPQDGVRVKRGKATLCHADTLGTPYLRKKCVKNLIRGPHERLQKALLGLWDVHLSPLERDVHSLGTFLVTLAVELLLDSPGLALRKQPRLGGVADIRVEQEKAVPLAELRGSRQEGWIHGLRFPPRPHPEG
mmetsp:Transcript_1543/g.4461  ORF Transcript_1543/g.4461 Transcript_1543/m.4461 type:complete len:212 (-) Transcript_1543:1291-1926(-)